MMKLLMIMKSFHPDTLVKDGVGSSAASGAFSGAASGVGDACAQCGAVAEGKQKKKTSNITLAINALKKIIFP